MRQLFRFVVSLFFSLVFAGQTSALGFKNPKISSFLNQPLQFQVDITDKPLSLPVEKYSIRSSFIGSEFYNQNTIEVNSRIISKTKDKKIILVTTRQNIKEPFIQLSLNLKREGMNVSRIFTILLEPPTLLNADSGEIYSVKVNRADTVWSIAERFLQDDLYSIEQMMMAIYRLNPDAFFGQNINRLKNEAELAIPNIEDILSLDKNEAKKSFLNQYFEWKNQNNFQDQNKISDNELDAQQVLTVLNSGETTALESSKNEKSLIVEPSSFAKANDELQMQLNRAQSAMGLLERKFEEQSEELAKLRAEISSLKLGPDKNTISPVVNPSDSKKEFNLWFYIFLSSFFILAIGIGFVLFKKSKARIRQMDINFANENSNKNREERTAAPEGVKNSDSAVTEDKKQDDSDRDSPTSEREPDSQIALSINSYLAYERYEDAIRECRSALDRFPKSVELNILMLKIFKESDDFKNFDDQYLKLKDSFEAETDEWFRITEKYKSLKAELSEKLIREPPAIEPEPGLELDLDIDIEKDVGQEDDKDQNKN